MSEIRHFHLFCGLGGGAAGFNRGFARVGEATARFRCIGGVDSDPAAVRDFGRLAGVPGTLLDLFSREQYIAWHGTEPPPDWREATPQDLHRAAGGERPHIIFTSPPCKGFSGLLSQRKSTGPKYRALNELTLRGIHLSLEAWADDPPEFFLLENVPRIAHRGRALLDAIVGLLEGYGYAVAETTHDCGELGGLAQSRRRFLLVARHIEKVPPFLYEPPKRPLRGVGEILGRLPLPGDVQHGGPMHRLPRLHWKTWVRLALIEAGGDWRSLQNLAIEDGYLRDLAIIPERPPYGGAHGVLRWQDHSGTITGNGSKPSCGRFAVADPRPDWQSSYAQLGVGRWNQAASTITSQRSPGQGRFSVADPRLGNKSPAFNNVFRVIRWGQACNTVTGASRPGSGATTIADPRCAGGFHGAGKYRVHSIDGSAGTVIAGSTTGQGAFAIADPRCGMDPERGHYLTGGQYGVIPWSDPAYVVSGRARCDSGRHSVADPRVPAATDQGVWIIRSLDDTWHRPFTTLELAALQSLVDPEDPTLELEGASDSAWRERIGNAVPRDAAAAIAGVMGTALLLTWSGQTFALDNLPIWVRPVGVALSVKQEPTP